MGIQLAAAALVGLAAIAAADGEVEQLTVHGFGADRAEVLAAKEARRYLDVLSLADSGRPSLTLHGGAEADAVATARAIGATEQGAISIVTASRDHPVHAAFRAWDASFGVALDAMQHRDSHLLHSLRTPGGGGTVVVCVGATPRATLYAAYSLAEHLGARFYLHGDVLPPPTQRLALPPPGFSQPWTPRFSVRGLQPFHDFPVSGSSFFPRGVTDFDSLARLCRWAPTSGSLSSGVRWRQTWPSSSSTFSVREKHTFLSRM